MNTKRTNCPNCGAPYDIDKDKCPYCGTIYFDMTAIDFNSREPIFLKIQVFDQIITQKCIPYFEGLKMESRPERFYADDELYEVDHSMSIETNIRFVAVCSAEDNFTLVKIEKQKAMKKQEDLK